MSKVAAAFESMDYGPAPESPAPADAFLDAHNRRFGVFINNTWAFPPGRAMAASVDPCTGAKLAESVEGTREDVDAAVAAAAGALPAWKALPGHARARFMYAIARGLQKHAKLLSVLEALDNGKTIRETRDLDVPLAIRHFYHHAGWAQVMDSEVRGYEAVGVVGAIIPWNFPLLMLAWKVAPALATGCTIVLKPAPSTRLTAWAFCQIVLEAGIPAGVVNVVSGDNDMAQHLSTHPGLDKIAFTGSTPVGRSIRKSLAGTGCKLTMELGGKSAMVVFQGADLDSATEGCVDAIWMNQGQVCCAGSRLLVQESIAPLLLAKLRRRLTTLRLGNSMDKCVDMAAIHTPAQLEKITRYVELGRAEGAQIDQAPGAPDVAGCKGGSFFPATLITGLQTASRLSQEEIFGPVLLVQTFRSPEEAVQIANHTPYGLSASVWAESVGVALDTASKLQAGVVWVNCHNMFDAAAGFGGCKQSGFGREGGKEGLYEYLVPSWKAARGRARVSPEALKAAEGPASETAANLQALGPGTSAVQGAGDVDRTSKIYIGGKQARSDSGSSYPVLAADGSVAGLACDCNRKDVRDAVEAAAGAAKGWSSKPGHTRAQILYFLAENLSARAAAFAARVAQITGGSLSEAEAEVAAAVDRIFTYAALADKAGGTVQESTLKGMVMAVNESVGAIGIVCPTAHPLLSLVSLLAAAVARGNAVVLIPARAAALLASDLYQLIETSDVPGGVINILTGDQHVLSLTLASHQGLDAFWCFAPLRTILAVEKLAAEDMKRTWTETPDGRDWMDPEQGAGGEFVRHATHVKNIWVPFVA